MDNKVGKIGTLVEKGSVYDLSATYIFLIDKQDKTTKEKYDSVTSVFKEILNKGYTYKEIERDILSSFYNNKPFPFFKYRNGKEGNLLKQDVRYYHRELIILPPPLVVNFDMNTGERTTSKIEYYVEPVASYTVEDLLKYFYSKKIADEKEFNPKRMAGFFKHEISVYGIDKVLFMVEAAINAYQADHKKFTVQDFETYNSTASDYLATIKSSVKMYDQDGDKYVLRERLLFD